MSVELITGYSGEPHISSADDGARNIGTFGPGKYVLQTGTELACSIQGANTAVIGSGDALFEGRHVRVTGTNEVALDNGAQGINRNDIICLYYQRDQATTVESVRLAVLKGTGTSGTPVDPTVPSGSIADGANEAYMALWRIPISGITPGTPVKLYGDVLPDMHELATRVTPVGQVPNISAAKITSGTLGVARGGTGKSTLTSNAVLAGNGTSAVKQVTTKSGALYATADNGASQFGTLPAAQGGTGQTSLQAARNAMGLGNTTGALPVANGGTGSTTASAARTALGLGTAATAASSDFAAASHNHAASNITSGTLGVGRGGTGLTASPSMLVNLGSTSAANVLQASPRPGVTGTLPVGNGGTGVTSNPSMLVNLASTNSASVFATSPRPGITGTLPVAHGGTGATSASAARTALGITPANIGAAVEPTVLYSNSSGARSVSISNLSGYSHLRIFFCANGKHSDNSRDEGCVEAFKSGSTWTDPNGMTGHRIDNTHSQLSLFDIDVSASGLSVGMRSYTNFANGVVPEVGQDDKAYVWRVEGW